MNDTTILRTVKSAKGQVGRLYYYQGNFFFPTIMLSKEQLRVKKAIRLFCYKNSNMIRLDRAKPDYLSYEQLLDEHGYNL